MNSDLTSYEVKFGWNRRTITLTAFCGFLLAAGVIDPLLPHHTNSLAANVLLVVFGLLGLWVGSAAALSGRLAMRVDEAGVVLARSPFRTHKTTLTVQWPDIEAIVLWRQQLPRGHSMKYIGLRVREDMPLPAREMGAAGRRISQVLVPVSPRLVSMSAAVNMWQLDEQRLIRTVAAAAPQVAVEEDPSWRR